jgi:hypothetical protein
MNNLVKLPGNHPVHIERIERPYGGDAPTLCGRVLNTGMYRFVVASEVDYPNCKPCLSAHTSGKR